MPEGKDHICTGSKCIYCQIAADEEMAGRASSLAIINEESLLRVKSLEAQNSLIHIETKAENKGKLHELEREAFIDPLSGLANVHVFLRELRYEIARAQRYKRPLTIGMIRVDNYDAVKNAYGPLGCELVLKHVGKVLAEVLREVDLPARLELDQFGIILPETNQAAGHIVAERIRRTLLRKPVKLKTFTLDLTCSAGIASFPKHGLDIDSLLDSCLNAQMGAAAQGGNQVLAL